MQFCTEFSKRRFAGFGLAALLFIAGCQTPAVSPTNVEKSKIETASTFVNPDLDSEFKAFLNSAKEYYFKRHKYALLQEAPTEPYFYLDFDNPPPTFLVGGVLLMIWEATDRLEDGTVILWYYSQNNPQFKRVIRRSPDGTVCYSNSSLSLDPPYGECYNPTAPTPSPTPTPEPSIYEPFAGFNISERTQFYVGYADDLQPESSAGYSVLANTGPKPNRDQEMFWGIDSDSRTRNRYFEAGIKELALAQTAIAIDEAFNTPRLVSFPVHYGAIIIAPPGAGGVPAQLFGRGLFGIQRAVSMGAVAEKVIGTYATSKVAISTITGTRIPDLFNRAMGMMWEVKNVRYLGLTPQMRGFLDYCSTKNMQMTLFIRRDTQIATTLRNEIARLEALAGRKLVEYQYIEDYLPAYALTM